MALKEYVVNGATFQFEEGKQPAGASLVGAKAAKAPANKSRTAANKQAKAPANKSDQKPAPPSGVEDASDPSASE